MNQQTSNEILTILKQIIPNPKCELIYHNTFELLCAVMISSQTTDKRVNMVTPQLFLKYPTPLAMSKARYEDVFEIIKSLGFAKTKANHLIEMSKMLHNEFLDVIPSTIEELTRLPGVGRKTASVVLVEGFHLPAMPVDTHLERMAKRLGYASEKDSVREVEEAYRKYIKEEDWIVSHHLFLLFGRYHCKAMNPQCEGCLLKKYCKEKKD
ncbi:MAG: endonuclease III [Anaeroplasmataceae bacterium]|nr:endonuclease III [Anaeroplasmataceae bacterium]